VAGGCGCLGGRGDCPLPGGRVRDRGCRGPGEAGALPIPREAGEEALCDDLGERGARRQGVRRPRGGPWVHRRVPGVLRRLGPMARARLSSRRL